MLEYNKVYLGDCLSLMNNIEDKSVDLVLCDLPYGTTKCKWDIIIPLEDYIEIEIRNKKVKANYWKFIEQICLKKNEMSINEADKYFQENKQLGLWSQYKRIIKDNGAILLFAQIPFSIYLASTNMEMLRYEWIWEKTQATGHANSKKMPMKAHENILVFYKHLPTYNPQKTTGHTPTHAYRKTLEVQNKTGIYGYMGKEIIGGGETDRFPRDVVKYKSDKQKNYYYQTQKPLALCEYMIKTYSNEGDLILDNTCGSGTSLVAAKNLNRNFIGIDNSENAIAITKERLNLCKKD